jgi:hypothetical protein
LPTNIADSEVPSVHDSLGHCAEHLSRIVDLEGRLSLLKQQAKTAMEQAGKSFGLLKKVSSLELWCRLSNSKNVMLSLLRSSSQHASNCNVSYLEPPECLLLLLLVSYILTSCFPGICLDPATENRRVFERVAALERVSLDTNTF